MTPAILRSALALALLLGAGVVANIFAGSDSEYAARPRVAAAEPARAKRPGDAGQPGSLTDGEQTHSGVRRELMGRGYLKKNTVASNDPVVRAAILAFEFDHGRAMTGIASEELLKALIFNHTALTGAGSPEPQTLEARAMIEETQRSLSELGYHDAQRFSGILDQATRDAIRRFERARGLEQSGRVSAPLIESLGTVFDPVRAGVQTVAGAKL